MLIIVMGASNRCERDFFARPTLTVARDLIGRVLVRRLTDGRELRARIVETEGYLGRDDSASHAASGRTDRTAIMFGMAGHAYVYFIYGMHYCFNVVTEVDGVAGAVLIRAAEPLSGVEAMQELRPNRPGAELTNGPAKLCQALDIDTTLNGVDLVTSAALWIEGGTPVPDADVERTPRIGIRSAQRADRDALRRYILKRSEWLSQ